MKSMKKTLSALVVAAMVAGCSSNTTTSQNSTSKGSAMFSVGVAQLVDHPSLNTIRESMMDEFEQQGYIEGENIMFNYQNAANKTSNLDSIMTGYAADEVNAIVAIATPTALAAQKYSDQIPLVFSAVSDPVDAGLVESNEHPGGNITGTSDEIQVEQIIDMMLMLSPEIKQVGILYNPGEANSVSTVSRFNDYAKTKGLEIMERTGTDNTTMQQAAVDLASQVDAMFSPIDNTVATGMVSLAQIARDAGVPYYVGADSMVETGGFATVGINYESLGRETAKMTIEILKGKSPADIPVKVFKDNLNVYINEDVLNDLKENGKVKVDIPEDLQGQENLILVQSEQ